MKNVAFGEIVHGIEVLNLIEKCGLRKNIEISSIIFLGSNAGKVSKKVVIEKCGKVDEKEYHQYDRHEHHDILAGGGH